MRLMVAASTPAVSNGTRGMARAMTAVAGSQVAPATILCQPRWQHLCQTHQGVDCLSLHLTPQILEIPSFQCMPCGCELLQSCKQHLTPPVCPQCDRNEAHTGAAGTQLCRCYGWHRGQEGVHPPSKLGTGSSMSAQQASAR